MMKGFSALVVSRPWLTLLLALLAGGLGIYLASLLRFDTRFSALLPQDTPEILEVNELQEKAGGTAELIIAVSGGDRQRKLRFGREVVKQLRTRRWIRRADVEFPVDFFLERRLLLLPTERLRRLQEAIDEEVERARARANPLYVDLEGDGDRPKPWADVDREDSLAQGTLLKRTYGSPDGRYLFIRVKPHGTISDMAAGKKLLRKIKTDVSAVDPGRHGVFVRYAGGLEINQEQNDRMMQDFKRASLFALVLILLLLTLYVRRIAAPVTLAVPLIVGVSITLGITALTIGQLNLVSGFLISALFGLGIDFEIHLYLRYLEELDVETDRKAAMRQAMFRTLPGCTTAAATTAAAFFAMTISDFRGYREYGLIAGIGVLVTLVVTFIALPPLALLLERRARAVRTRRPRQLSARLAWLMVAAGAALLVFSLVVGPRVRWHNDFRKLRGVSDNVDFSEYVGDLLGGDLTPAAILVKDLQQARQVEDYLDARFKKPGSWVKQHLSLAAMVPHDVKRRMAIIRQIERSLRSVPLDRLKPDDRKRVTDALRLTRVKPWSVADVPGVFRGQFQTVEGDGQLRSSRPCGALRDEAAQFVVVWPRYHTNIDHEIVAWGDVLTRIQAELRGLGIPVKIMDENRISARVLAQMRADAPYVLAAAAVAVLVILIIDFRRVRRVLMVAGTLGVGIAWMLGVMHLWGIDVNVFNQAVLATIIGVGIDNVIHIQHRYLEQGPGSVATVVSSTGSAALLASATTAIGFGAAVTAHHLGIRSLGWLAITGLSCTFIASTVFYPAVLRLLDGPGDQR